MVVKVITAYNLESDFGLNSVPANIGIKLLLSKLQNSVSIKTKHCFNEWKNHFKQRNVTGKLSENVLQQISWKYHLHASFERDEIIFIIHTYLAMIIKLIAIELIHQMLQLQDKTPLRDLLGQPSSELKDYFDSLEKNKVFPQLGFPNLLADINFFGWYVQEWDEHLEMWVRSCLQLLSNYSVPLSNQESDIADDLFRSLYHQLLTPALRRELGEVYTPKWLVEFMIEDAEYEGNLKKKILDPACGSGTFLIHLIKIAQIWSNKMNLKRNINQLLEQGIVGFDLNPIAILAARINYLWAARSLIEVEEPFHIPVHLVDSLTFNISKTKDRFDYIIGNPPWINWEYLPEDFKKICLKLWEGYGLFPIKGWKGKLGHAKYDISAVFVYACIDNYLRNGGTLEFLVTQALVRGIPGRGFRKYEINKGLDKKDPIQLKLKKIHDLTRFQPFEDITTRTAIVKLVRNEKTLYPVPYIQWEKKGQVSPNDSWNDVVDAFQLNEKMAAPIKKEDPLSRPIIVNSEIQSNLLHDIFQSSEYKAREGANTEGLNCVFWINHLKKEKNGLISFQQILKGVKKKIVAKKPTPIEPKLIFPLIRSGDLHRWHYTPKAYIIFTAKYDERFADESIFRNEFPETYKYLCSNFKDALLERKGFIKKSAKYPFYILFGTEEMKHPYKICWLRMGSRIDAAVITEYDDPVLGKKSPIPQETIVFLNVRTLNEAHYVCAILNSEIFTNLVSMFSMKGAKGFASVNILKTVRLPKFDADNPRHKQLALESTHAHHAIKQGLDVAWIERKINQLAEELFFAELDPHSRDLLKKQFI